MSSRKLTRGPKFNKEHQSIIKAAECVLTDLKSNKKIDKIVIGKIKNTRSRHAKLIHKVNKTSVELTVKSHGELQAFYLLGTNPSLIGKIIDKYIKRFH